MDNGLSKLGERTKDPPISWLMKVALDKPELISLAAGFTDGETLPVSDVRKIVSQLCKDVKYARNALQYGSTQGDPELRKLTAQRVKDLDCADSASYSAERVLITNGSQQLLYIIVEALCDAGDIVLVEAPTYFVFLGILQSHGIKPRSVKIESDGININQLQKILEELSSSGEIKRVKFLYSITYAQNPTSITTSLQKKIQTIRILKSFEKYAGHPIYYVEDAAYRELSFIEDVPSSLTYTPCADRVIYAGTYSKPFATGIRIGYGIIPHALIKVFCRIKGNQDFGSPNFLQKIILRAIESGIYDQHLKVLSKRYLKKAHIMKSAIEKYFDSTCKWTMPGGGMYFWLSLPPGVKTGLKSKFFSMAIQNNVLYVPGELCYADDPEYPAPKNELRLSYGNATEEEITTGIERLGGIYKQLM